MFVFIVGMITETSAYSEGLYDIISPLRLYIINKKVEVFAWEEIVHNDTQNKTTQ